MRDLTIDDVCVLTSELEPVRLAREAASRAIALSCSTDCLVLTSEANGASLITALVTKHADAKFTEGDLFKHEHLLSMLPKNGVHEYCVSDPEIASFVELTGFNVDHIVVSVVASRHKVFGWIISGRREMPYSEQEKDALDRLRRVVSVAARNARIYGEARDRERWLFASQGISTLLLSGTTEDEALQYALGAVRQVAKAEGAALILPSLNDIWVCEICDGPDFDIVGVPVSPTGRAMRVANTGVGILVDSMSELSNLRVESLRNYGPALYAPMRIQGKTIGVVLLVRNKNQREFTDTDLKAAETVAEQAALAMRLAQAKHQTEIAKLQTARERIGRDLHDLAIQQLFAAGMQLSSLRDSFQDAIDAIDATKIDFNSTKARALMHKLESALDSVGSSATQIRHIVNGIKNSASNRVFETKFVTRVIAESSLARTLLGFAPSVVIRLDDQILSTENDCYLKQTDTINEMVSIEVANDVVAVVREAFANIAKHAHATAAQLHICVQQPHSKLVVAISDNGVGIPQDNDRSSGLSNMLARARANNGTMETYSNKNGTLLRWEVPL